MSAHVNARTFGIRGCHQMIGFVQMEKGEKMSKYVGTTAKITIGIIDLIEELKKFQIKNDRQLKVLKREQWKKRSRRH